MGAVSSFLSWKEIKPESFRQSAYVLLTENDGKIVRNNVAQKMEYSKVRTHILHISNVNIWRKKLK